MLRRGGWQQPAGSPTPSCGAVAVVGSPLVLGGWPLPPACRGTADTEHRAVTSRLRYRRGRRLSSGDGLVAVVPWVWRRGRHQPAGHHVSSSGAVAVVVFPLVLGGWSWPLVWQKPLAQPAPKLGRCRRAASRVWGTGRSASRNHAIPVVKKSPNNETRRWCSGQQFLGREGEVRPSPAVPTLIPPGSPQHLAPHNLPPQHLPTGLQDNSRQKKCRKPSSPCSTYYQAQYP